MATPRDDDGMARLLEEVCSECGQRKARHAPACEPTPPEEECREPSHAMEWADFMRPAIRGRK